MANDIADIADTCLSPKQIEYILNSNAKLNFAHGSVRSGKTVCNLIRFMHEVYQCPGKEIWMIGHTSDTIYHNAVRLLTESEILPYRGYCTWHPGSRRLTFMDKTIFTIGAKDEGAVRQIQGHTFDLCYCDEMALFPDSVIQMIDTRLSMPHSKLFASLNPLHPGHIIKKTYIDKADNKYFYALHFGIDDNVFLTEEYKARLRESLSGVFYRRNYLGEWCLAEGAIFDFFDTHTHVIPRPPRNAETYWVGIDYGTANPCSFVLIGYNSGSATQTGPQMWVEKEYYWDPAETHQQKTNFDFALDLEDFVQGYAVDAFYLDPSALSFQVELKRRGINITHADNDVTNGIQKLQTAIITGVLTICSCCKNLVREIEGYVWDTKKAERGIEEPVKKEDHAVDALRYAIYTKFKAKKNFKLTSSEEALYSQERSRINHWTNTNRTCDPYRS